MMVKKTSDISKGAVGFVLHMCLPHNAKDRLTAAQSQALYHFPWLKTSKKVQGDAVVCCWSHYEASQSLYQAQNGTLFVLVGSPMNDVSWPEALQQLSRKEDENFELPWEGRCVLIRISSNGRDWTMWNDWCGSIPVFHTSVRGVPIASSLEPVVVAAAGFTPNDFLTRGLIELLVHGHFLGNDTLYQDMHTLPPDSVSRWEEGRLCGSRRLWTVKPSDTRWDYSWDELAFEMHELTVKSISSALHQHEKWLLPLSGGMDSRLIACVAKETGTDIHAYTYGPSRWYEVAYARQLARTLGIQWERVDLGVDYLADYTPMWLDWFGSSLHTHGMYQMPFLQAVGVEDAPILQGFLGDPLAGNHLYKLMESGSTPYQHFCNFSSMWEKQTVAAVLTFNPVNSFSEIADIVQEEFNSLSGAKYQRLMFLDFWNRQRNFIFYHPMMYEYWNGVSTPYMNREYARFCLSLPRQALEGRRLQRDMLKRFWPEAAMVTATFKELTLTERVKRSLMHRIARWLPYSSLYRALQKSLPLWPNTMQIDCVSARKWESLYPLTPTLLDSLPHDGYLNRDAILETCRKALTGDKKAHTRLLPIQTVLWRINQNQQMPANLTSYQQNAL